MNPDDEPTDPDSRRYLALALDVVTQQRDTAREDFRVLCKICNIDPMLASSMVTGWKRLHGSPR